MIDADYTDDPTLLANAPAQAKFLLHILEQAAGGINFYLNTNKTKFMWFKQERPISVLSGNPLKLQDQFTYLSNNISSTKKQCQHV